VGEEDSDRYRDRDRDGVMGMVVICLEEKKGYFLVAGRNMLFCVVVVVVDVSQYSRRRLCLAPFTSAVQSSPTILPVQPIASPRALFHLFLAVLVLAIAAS